MEHNFLCEFVTNDNVTFQCKNCGLKVQIADDQTDPPVFPCKRPLLRKAGEEVTFAQKLKNFAKATAEHVINGMPMCTEEQIIARHNICLTCEFFKDDTCGKCGCPLIRNKQFVSKLAWADQECPVGKWGKIVN